MLIAAITILPIWMPDLYTIIFNFSTLRCMPLIILFSFILYFELFIFIFTSFLSSFGFIAFYIFGYLSLLFWDWHLAFCLALYAYRFIPFIS